ncbi:MAG: hypothetical protein V1882_01170 [Candidatus Omnitrophota bacterium]
MLSVIGRSLSEGEKNDSSFWEQRLPQLAKSEIGSVHVYDEIIIDEFQDLTAEPYLDFISQSLKGGLQSGSWKFFGDFEKQMLYESSLSLKTLMGGRLAGVAMYEMRINCRNTPRIASMARYLGGMSPNYKRVLRSDDGIEPQLIYYSSENDQLVKLEALIEKYRKDGFELRDIIILSGKSEPESCAHRLAQKEKWSNVLKQFSFDQNGFLAYTSIHAFKGLERSVVILTDLSDFSSDTTLSRCYVGMSRALNRLSVLVGAEEQGAIITRMVGIK